jgi:hypothetical protein
MVIKPTIIESLSVSFVAFFVRRYLIVLIILRRRPRRQ